VADNGTDPNPANNPPAWKRSLKGYKSGNPPEDVRRNREDDLRDLHESIRNVTPPQQFKRGGKVRGNRAVLIIAHENERVIPANKRKKVEKLMRRAGMRLTNRKSGSPR
jgi:hypothetical protein